MNTSTNNSLSLTKGEYYVD